MKVACAKLELIKPDEVNMEEYKVSEGVLTRVWLLLEMELWLISQFLNSELEKQDAESPFELCKLLFCCKY